MEGRGTWVSARLERRSALKGLVGLMSAGMVASLAAACAPQAPTPAKSAESKPAQPAAAPPAPAASQPKVEAAAKTEARPAAAQPKRGGILKVAIIGEPPALDSTFTTATITSNVTWHIFERPFERNDKLEPKPYLVEKYTASPDGKNWSFDVRKGVRFHDDTEMVAADMVASIKRWLAMSGRGKFTARRLDAIDSKDKYSFTMTFKEPMGVLPTFLAQRDVPVMPSAVADAHPKDKLSKWVGTGPFKHIEHIPDRHVRYGRFDKYVSLDQPTSGAWGKKTAYVDEVLFIPTPEGSVRASGVGTGEYHFAESLEPDQYDSLKGMPGVKPQIVKPNYWYTAHFNKKEGLFTNQKLRQAVLAVSDMRTIMLAGWGREDFVRLGPEIAAPETIWYNDEGKDVYNKVDIDKAKALMKEAGYDGTPVRWMSTKEYFYNYNMSLPFKQAMESAGFKVDLQVMDWATLVKRRADPKEYDVFVTGHPAFDHPVLQVYLEAGWPGWWASADKDKVVNAILGEPDIEKQKALVKQLQAIQWREVPCVKAGEGLALRAHGPMLQNYNNFVDWYFWNTWLS